MGLLEQINLNYLRIFLVVYRTRSMTLAAKELHLTQSGVSQQIKSLEDNLRVTLFDRMNRKIIPTAHAEILFHECSQKLDELEETLEKISSVKANLTGKVRIGFPPIFGQHVLLPLIAKFHKENLEVTFEMKVGLADEIIDLLEEGELDFAFIDSFAKTPQLVTESVFLEHLDLCCHPDLLPQFGPYEFSFKYFKKLPYIGYLTGEPIIRNWFHTNFDSTPHQLNIVASIMDSNAIARLVIEGVGVGLLPEVLLQQLEQNQGIHRFKSHHRVANNIALACLDKRTLTPTASRFMVWIKQTLAQLPPH